MPFCDSSQPSFHVLSEGATFKNPSPTPKPVNVNRYGEDLGVSECRRCSWGCLEGLLFEE